MQFVQDDETDSVFEAWAANREASLGGFFFDGVLVVSWEHNLGDMLGKSLRK